MIKKLIYKSIRWRKNTSSNYPKRATIFTVNFWKLIVIHNLQWLNSRPAQLKKWDILMQTFIHSHWISTIGFNSVKQNLKGNHDLPIWYHEVWAQIKLWTSCWGQMGVAFLKLSYLNQFSRAVLSKVIWILKSLTKRLV